MAAVDVVARSGHSVVLRERHKPGKDPDIVPSCTCGWSGPSYDPKDRGSAEQAVKFHLNDIRDKPDDPIYLAMLTLGSGRADPEDRLRSSDPEAPGWWSWSKAGPQARLRSR